jgi:uncharacterized protein YjiS (DUF1127 family)
MPAKAPARVIAAGWAEPSEPINLGVTFSRLLERMRRYRAARRTRLVLSELDDHTLDDIGLDPSHVRRTRPGAVDWVIQSHAGTARLVFIGR